MGGGGLQVLDKEGSVYQFLGGGGGGAIFARCCSVSPCMSFCVDLRTAEPV